MQNYTNYAKNTKLIIKLTIFSFPLSTFVRYFLINALAHLRSQ